MSLHVFLDDQLKLLAAYEIGSVAFYQFAPSDQHRLVTKVSDYGFEGSIEGRGWECLWKVRVHNESGSSLIRYDAAKSIPWVT